MTIGFKVLLATMGWEKTNWKMKKWDGKPHRWSLGENVPFVHYYEHNWFNYLL